MAPFTPFIAEYICQTVDGPDESVHLQAWPEIKKGWINNKVLSEMEPVRKIVEAGLAARAAAGVKIRQPLASYSTSLVKELPPEYLLSARAAERHGVRPHSQRAARRQHGGARVHRA
ncbi:MAG: class I tRNA ligase family protein [Verrucomicrobia bacterium]|nr:class I tRNA ligase family protein [Verrucomicrobiota bacterium]